MLTQHATKHSRNKSPTHTHKEKHNLPPTLLHRCPLARLSNLFPSLLIRLYLKLREPVGAAPIRTRRPRTEPSLLPLVLENRIHIQLRHRAKDGGRIDRLLLAQERAELRRLGPLRHVEAGFLGIIVFVLGAVMGLVIGVGREGGGRDVRTRSGCRGGQCPPHWGTGDSP